MFPLRFKELCEDQSPAAVPGGSPVKGAGGMTPWGIGSVGSGSGCYLLTLASIIHTETERLHEKISKVSLLSVRRVNKTHAREHARTLCNLL